MIETLSFAKKIKNEIWPVLKSILMSIGYGDFEGAYSLLHYYWYPHQWVDDSGRGGRVE